MITEPIIDNKVEVSGKFGIKPLKNYSTSISVEKKLTTIDIDSIPIKIPKNPSNIY